MGESQVDTEDIHKTADSTFKPKSLRNRAQEKMEKARKEMEEQRQREIRKNYIEPVSPFKVTLKPTGINENASHSVTTKKATNSHVRSKLVSLKKTKGTHKTKKAPAPASAAEMSEA